MHLGVIGDLPILSQLLTPEAARLLTQTVSSPPMPAAAAFVERHRLQREWSAFFLKHSVLVGPTWCDAQFAHGADLDAASGADTTLRRLRFILPGNVLGIPATAVAAGLSDAGLPLGVQIYADLWRDDLTLTAAQIIEGALGTLTCTIPRKPISGVGV